MYKTFSRKHEKCFMTLTSAMSLSNRTENTGNKG